MGAPAYRYFLAKGRSLDTVKTYHEAHTAAIIAMTKLFDDTGATESLGDGARMRLYIPRQAEPKIPGFHRMKSAGDGWWGADTKTPEGKALTVRLKTIIIPSRSDLKLGISPLLTNSMHVYYPVPELVGETWIIKVPYLDGKPCQVPHDAEPLKTSAYWLMKEALEEKVAEPRKDA